MNSEVILDRNKVSIEITFPDRYAAIEFHDTIIAKLRAGEPVLLKTTGPKHVG
jgi:hypothetical protein